MKLSSEEQFSQNECDLIAFPYWQGESEPLPACSLSHAELTTPSRRDFNAKPGNCLLLYPGQKLPSRSILVGLGKETSLTLENLRRAYADFFVYCRKMKWQRIAIQLPQTTLKTDETLRAVVEAAMLVNYRFQKYKSKAEEGSYLIEELTCLGCSEKEIQAAHAWVVIGECVHIARDLVNSSADEITPQYLGQWAKDLAKKYSLSCKLHDKQALSELNMGLILAVSRASSVEPLLIELSYKGAADSDEHEVWIGKGITYDTGGYTLKSPESMETMRCDMAGAAAALGALEAAVRLKIPRNITVVIPATENSIGALSYKLGDIYRACDGTTVEIGNTDAEGRLVLADAIAYVRQKYNPTRIIDIATLTGAIGIALGRERMGLFSNSDTLAQRFYDAGESTGEKVFRMPLDEDYAEELKSDLADIRNVGGRYGAAILAAHFIKKFIGATPWVHLDIASLAFLPKSLRYFPKYATGVGVRLLVESLLKK